MYNMLRNKKSKDEIHFLIFSLEIPESVLIAKLMGLYCAEEFGIYLTLDDILSFQTPLNDNAYEHLKSAKKWIESVSDSFYVVDKSCNCNTIYSETLKFASKYGTFEESDGRKYYIPNNPKQLLIGVIDHGLLLQPTQGRDIKEEIDLTSAYMVTLKNRLNMSWFMLMQQNRSSTEMDRRKEGLSEPGLNDIKSTGNVGQDADCVLQLFYPFREKLNTYRGYKIVGENGLGRNHRSIIISKQRYGVADQVININFFGSVGWWKELPSPDQITDYSKFQTEFGNIPCKNKKIKELKDDSTSKQVDDKKPIIFNF